MYNMSVEDRTRVVHLVYGALREFTLDAGVLTDAEILVAVAARFTQRAEEIASEESIHQPDRPVLREVKRDEDDDS
jgi:hypothetical protein